MDAKDLNGIAVVSIDHGDKLGTVNDTLFNLDARRIAAFVVNTGGSIFGSSKRILDLSDVRSIGSDAIMVTDRSVLRDEQGHAPGFPDLDALTSLRVVTESGTYIGNVAAIEIDPTDGAITGIEVSRGGLASLFKSNLPIPVSDVISMGRDVAIVRDAYAHHGQPDETHADVPDQPATS